MKNNLLLILLGICFCSNIINQSARADVIDPRNGQWGLGIVLGEPSGFTGKYWYTRDQAIDANLAYSFDEFLYFSSDYLFHFPGLAGHRSDFAEQLFPYAGIGLAMIFSTNSSRATKSLFSQAGSGSFGMGIRIPLGVEWQSPRVPIGVFLELVPGLGIVPSNFGFLQGGAGIRYYFE